MSRTRQPRRREWNLSDVYVGKKDAPEKSGLVSLKEPGGIISLNRWSVRLIGLTPLHPQIARQVRWCAELEGQEFKLLAIHQDRVLYWLDLANKKLGIELRCYLIRPVPEQPS